jgi:hypothetical protein
MRSTRTLMLAAALGLLAMSLAGCGADSASTLGTDTAQRAATDEEAIGMMIAEDTDSFGFGSEFDDSEQTGLVELGGRSGRQGAPIDSFYFIRLARVTSSATDIQIEHPAGEPAVATVTVSRDLEGIFRLYYDDPTSVYLPGILDKPLAAKSTRRARFVQRDGLSRHRNWRLVGISGVEVESVPVSKLIQSVEIMSSSVNMVITDPLELVPMRELMHFRAGEPVTVRVTTGDENDYVFLHTPFRKREFQPLGGGVYEGTWTTSSNAGRYRAAVDVIDEATLFEDEAAYDSVIWGFQYLVGPLADVPGGTPNGSGDPS